MSNQHADAFQESTMQQAGHSQKQQVLKQLQTRRRLAAGRRFEKLKHAKALPRPVKKVNQSNHTAKREMKGWKQHCDLQGLIDVEEAKNEARNYAKDDY